MPKLQGMHRSPRTTPVSWQWSTHQCFLRFSGMFNLHKAQQFSWLTTIASYWAGVIPYRLSSCSRNFSGWFTRRLASLFLLDSRHPSGSDARHLAIDLKVEARLRALRSSSGSRLYILGMVRV